MFSNKCDARHNLKLKGNSMLQGYKNTPTVSLHSARHKIDHLNKSKIEPITPTTLSKKNRKPHNCLIANTPPTCKKLPHPPFILKRKSVSLVELTENTVWTPKKSHGKEHVDEIKAPHVFENESVISCLSSRAECELAKKGFTMFILHAWRQRRKQAADLQNTAQKLGNEVQNLNIQTVVLRKLLESEKQRVTITMSDSVKLNQHLEDELKCTKELKEHLSEIETEKSLMENKFIQMDSEIQTLKHDLSLAIGEIEVLKEENANNQQDLVNCRGKESQLLHKLGAVEACLRDKITKFHNMKKKASDFQTEIEELILKNENLCTEKETKEKKLNDCIILIKKMEGEVNNLQNIRRVQHENIINLAKDVAVANEIIKKQENTIKNFRCTIQQYESERKAFESNLLKVRNQAIFEAIRISASLLCPNPSTCVMM